MNNQKLLAIVQVMSAFALWSTLGVFFQRVHLPVSVSVVYGSSVSLIACRPCVFPGPLRPYFLLQQSKASSGFAR